MIRSDLLAITGASGQLGRMTAEASLDRVEPRRLVLITRQPEKLRDLAARGAQVRFGDFDRPEELRSALAGVDRLLLVSAVDLARRAAQHRNAVDAARHAGVRHIAYTSMLSPTTTNPAAVAPSHRETEALLRDSGIDWTLLRNSLYADYQAPEALQAIATGRFMHNRGKGRIAYVARADCAAAAAVVLTSAGHVNATYEITGPNALDPLQLAGIYGALGNRPVEAVAVDDATMTAALLVGTEDDGHARYGASLLVSFGQAIRDGHLAACSNAVADLTGRPAQPLETLLAPLVCPG